MKIKMPKKLKNLLEIRITELELARNELITVEDYETPPLLGLLLDKVIVVRANRYIKILEIVERAEKIVEDLEVPIDKSVDSDVHVGVSSYVSGDIETNIILDAIGTFKNQEFGVWLLEFLV